MTLLLTIDHVTQIVNQLGIDVFFARLIARLRQDYAAWATFQKVPRLATHFPEGVIELMPIADDSYYAFKYVNGHPNNPAAQKLTVAAVGMLSDVNTGYPLLITEMTVLTAFRTAAASALASTYLAREQSQAFGMIGTGAQAEFQVLAHQVALGMTEVFYYDVDPAAMTKFENNLQAYPLTLHRCESAAAVIAASDIVTTATADKRVATVIKAAALKPGLHINAIGGDCPGKTELDVSALAQCKIVVQYLAQTLVEGEIQHLHQPEVYAELWELAGGKKPGRTQEDEVTVFDSVGFALEDYSVLRVLYDCASHLQLGEHPNIVPVLKDPKNLFGLLGRP